jgi:hypothetical protein
MLKDEVTLGDLLGLVYLFDVSFAPDGFRLTRRQL